MAARLFDDPHDEDRIARQVEMRRQQRAAMQHDEGLAQRTAAIRRSAQTGPTSLALAKAGRNANDPLVVRTGAAAARAREARGFGLHSIGDVLKGTSRVAFTALETPLQELQGVIRGAGWAGAATLQGQGNYLGNLKEGLGHAGRSTGWKAIEDLLSGDDVELGTGFFSGGKIAEEHTRDSEYLTLGGRPITTGRVVAARVAEPGSTAYNLVSGLLDASVAVFADPANIAGAKVSEVRQARRLFATEADAAGLVAGARKTVLAERVDGWLAGKGVKVIERLKDTNDTYEVWRLLGRKVEPAVAAQLADARTADEVTGILRPLLGVQLREKPTVPGLVRGAAGDAASGAFQAVFRRNPASVRLAQVMPGGAFHLDDDAQAVTQMERFLRNARVPDEMVARYVDRLARAASPIEKYNVIVTDMLGDVMGELAGRAGAQKARSLTTVWRNNYRELSKYFVDEIGENVGTKAVTIAGREFQVPSPHLYSEYIHSAIPSPDARAIRRLTSGAEAGPGQLWSKVVNSKGWDATSNVLDFLSQDVWKPFALLRGAWTVRVVGEEQVRMAASNLDSIVGHPLRAIAWATGRRGGVDVLGEEFNALDDATDFARSLSQKGGGWRNRIVSHGKTVVNRNDDVDRYVVGHQGELLQMANDPIAKRVAGGFSVGDGVPGGLTGDHVEDAKRWFFDGPGRKFREEIAEASGRGDLLTRDGADAYIDSVRERIRIKTSDDQRLIDAIATNKLEGQRLDDLSVRTTLAAFAEEGIGPEMVKADIVLAGRPTAGGKVGEYMNQATDWLFTNLMSKETNWLSRSPAFRQFYYKRLTELMPHMDDATQALVINGARNAGLDAKFGDDVVKRMERMVGRGSGSTFNTALVDDTGRPLKVFHGTIHKFDTWDEAAATATRTAVAGEAGDINEGAFFFTKARDYADMYVGLAGGHADEFGRVRGTPTIKEAYLELHNPYYSPTAGPFTNKRIAELKAKGYDGIIHVTKSTADASKDLTEYAVFSSRQIHETPDAMSLALTLEDADTIAKGFGLDATKNLLFDLSEKSQAADIARIIFPFAEAWREILTRWSRIGVENPIAIRRGQQAIEGARGAGWFATDPQSGQEVFNYPGTGFLMRQITGVQAPLQGSVAALNLFSNNPFIPGFGPVVQVTVGKLIPDKPQWDMVRDVITPYGESDTGDGFVESFLPPWLQKWRTAMDDPESDRQFANTVMDVARFLVSTGDYSTSTPAEQERLSAAAVQKARAMYLIRGAAQWIAPSAPRPEMMAHDKEGNLVTAFKLTEEFRKLQEDDYETAVQKFLDTYGEEALLFMQPKSRGGFTPTDDLHEWVRRNPQLAKRYKDTYGFFAPAGGEFNITEMDRQVATGERDALTPDEAVSLANQRVASAKYRAARERVGSRPSSTQKAWLREVKDALVAEYPGYEPEKVELGSVDTQIRELQRAVNEPVIADTDAGRALAKYLQARERAVSAAQAKGLASFGRAKSMRATRMWLRDVADALIAEHPEFGPLWERVLEREMVDDTQEATVA